MKDKGLARVLDQVKLAPEREKAILADLLSEKREALSMKQTNRRRIPAAALAGAVLVIVLAGTALAAGYWGRVTIIPQNRDTGGGKESNYEIYGNCDPIPAENLSEAVLALVAETDEFGSGMIARDFASLSECEAFLGLELADNPVLEQQDHTLYVDGMPETSSVYAYFYQGLLSSIRVDSFYEVDGCRINEYALLRTEDSSDMARHDVLLTTGDEAVIEEYVTPHGIRATVFTEATELGEHVYSSAFFTKDNAVFVLSILSEDGCHNKSVDTALDILKNILDAYE